jgi:2-phospho-L-lactate guanylyltransferase
VPTAAILPVKRFELAKQRLGVTLSPLERRTLAEAMVTDVLQALAATAAIDRVIVVTNEARAAARAGEIGATVIPDELESGQSDAAEQGIARALAGGADRVLLVPGDCPWLSPRELQSLLARPTDEPEVVVIPDRHGTGTNGLLLTPPSAISPAFGPGSFERHRQRAVEAGVHWEAAPLDTLMLDIDTGEDLLALRAALARHPGRAVRTRQTLARLLDDNSSAA